MRLLRLRLLRRRLLFGRLHLIIRGQDITRRTKTTRKAQHSAGVGQLGAAQIDLVVRHHLHELKNLIKAASRVRSFRKKSPKRGVYPVQVAAPVRREEIVVDSGHAFSKEATCSANDGRLDCCDVQQEIFSHLALMSVELANSFWPRKLSATPIRVFNYEALFEALEEHFIPRLQIVHKEEAVGFPRCLLVQLVELLQGAELLHHGVQLVLVAQPPAAEELLVDPHGCTDEPQLLRANSGADLHVPAPDEESVQGAVWFMQLRHVRKIVQDDQHLVQFLHLQLLGRLRDLALLLDDAPQRRLVPILPVGLVFLHVHPQVPSIYFLTGIQPSSTFMLGLKM